MSNNDKLRQDQSELMSDRRTFDEIPRCDHLDDEVSPQQLSISSYERSSFANSDNSHKSVTGQPLRITEVSLVPICDDMHVQKTQPHIEAVSGLSAFELLSGANMTKIRGSSSEAMALLPPADELLCGPKESTALAEKGKETKAIEANAAVEAKSVSKEFATKIDETYKKIPKQVRTEMEAAGYKVLAAHHMTHKDAFPELAGQRPRGWPPGKTWDHADGTVRFDRKTVIVTETRLDAAGKWVNTDRAEGVLRHEYGHAVNSVWGKRAALFSDGNDFKAAYERDLRNIKPADKAALAYYLQSGSAGRDETFADIFALLTGGPANSSDAARLRAAFPEVAKVVQKRIDKK